MILGLIPLFYPSLELRDRCLPYKYDSKTGVGPRKLYEFSIMEEIDSGSGLFIVEWVSTRLFLRGNGSRPADADSAFQKQPATCFCSLLYRLLNDLEQKEFILNSNVSDS